MGDGVMRSSLGSRFGRVAVAVAVIVSAAVGAGTGPVAAATITFGTPSASSAFGDGVRFVQPYFGSADFREVDIVIDYPGSFGPSVAKVEKPGASSFSYKLDTSSGELQPNTQLVARFEITFTDGTVEDGPDINITYLDDRFKWQTKVGKVVRLHWYQGDDAFADQALQMGERGIAAAADFMDHAEAAPIDFYVYADRTPFYDALGPSTRENVGGEANTQTRTLFALISPSELAYAATVVPHELTHVAFDDATTNPYHQPPHWLNEGIAVYVSQGFDLSDKQLVGEAASGGGLMPLAAIRGQFPTTQDRFYLAYAESVSAVDYFVRTYGHDDLVKLVKSFGTGASDDEAFQTAIGMGVDAFDKAWMKANGVTDLQSFGPQPAPTGPVPSDWIGGGAAPGGGNGGRSQEGIPAIVLVAGAGVALLALILLVVVSRRRSSRGAA